jgi:hypothetical protein
MVVSWASAGGTEPYPAAGLEDSSATTIDEDVLEARLDLEAFRLSNWSRLRETLDCFEEAGPEGRRWG